MAQAVQAAQAAAPDTDFRRAFLAGYAHAVQDLTICLCETEVWTQEVLPAFALARASSIPAGLRLAPGPEPARAMSAGATPARPGGVP
jgi:hypothetical protein